MTEATDHLGNEVTAEQIVRQLAVMLGWGNTPPWHVLERDLASKLLRLKELGAEAAELRAREMLAIFVCEARAEGLPYESRLDKLHEALVREYTLKGA